jgi:hypothetical protein
MERLATALRLASARPALTAAHVVALVRPANAPHHVAHAMVPPIAAAPPALMACHDALRESCRDSPSPSPMVAMSPEGVSRAQ